MIRNSEHCLQSKEGTWIKLSLIDWHRRFVSSVFFLAKFCTVAPMWAKFPLWNVQSDLLEKMSKICHIWGKKVRSRHIEKMNLWRLPKQSRILKYFYFALWPVAKFGSSLFWMIASPSTWQKWKKKKKKPFVCEQWPERCACVNCKCVCCPCVGPQKLLLFASHVKPFV
jgi:hypothetical protein